MSRRELLSLGAVMLAGFGAARLFQRAAPLGRDASDILAAQALVHDRVSPRRDVAGADLTMVVFTDYQCPACKAAAPAMAAAVARDGRVRVVYKDWPVFGPRSERAARVALAAERQGVYLDFHGRLMAVRRPLDDRVLKSEVEAAGGNWAQILADLATHGDAIDKRIARNGADAFALSLPGTPAYLIGPLLVVGALDADEFIRAFTDARAMQARNDEKGG